MNRRTFLATTAATLVAPKLSFAATAPQVLRAEAFKQQIVSTSYAGETSVFGFNGSVPGPELRLVQGTELKVRLDNQLNEGSAIHWHGIRLKNKMDGVPYLTQKLVEPGDDFTYAFTPPDAGTYWYHSHHMSQVQVARGLMGPLVVEENTPPDVDHDIVAMLTDWRLNKDGQLTEDFGRRHDMAHAGRIGNFVRAFMPNVTVKEGERIRLRFINAATDRIFPLIIRGLNGKIVALDGMPLPEPRDVRRPFLAPAQRMDIIADVTGHVTLEMASRRGTFPLGTLIMDGKATPRSSKIAPLPAHNIEKPDEPLVTMKFVMAGGAMGGRHAGNDIWSFNGVSGMKPSPLATFKRGETIQLGLVNDTRFPHGIHLHGHHFYEVKQDGTLGDFRDTSLVAPQRTKDIICKFDNPGQWMLHCHMLSHQAGGMKTWIEVI